MILDNVKDLKVMVIGDIILDRYYQTDVERISPEAPIPIAKYKSEKNILGGAANVSKNLSELGICPIMIGKISRDDNGNICKKLFKENNINYYPIYSNYPTIVKTRIISGSHQMLRIDFEEDYRYSEIEDDLIVQALTDHLNEVDIIIVSDYDKGVISQKVITFLNNCGKYISMDAKILKYNHIDNFNLIKPNFKESLEMSKLLGLKGYFKNIDKDVEKIGYYITKITKTNLLITRGKEGCSYISKNGEFYHSKLEVKNVNDVTGAGDTSISIFSLLDYLNHDKENSLFIMNNAAKLTVSNLGNYSPSISEIKKEMYQEDIEMLFDEQLILDNIFKAKKDGKTIVFTNGCYDILHKGHVEYLNRAKKFGDVLVVGINTDSSVRRIKGESRPIIDEISRSFLISNLSSVDYVILFDESSPINLISKVKPDIHVKGNDYKIEDLIEKDEVYSHGGRIELIPISKGFSTTNIINKIKSEDKK